MKSIRSGHTVSAMLLMLLAATAPAQYSATILNPPGATLSVANAAQGGQQVGFAGHDLDEHAIVWTGSAGSAIDLTPPGWARSRAYGIANAVKVGTGAGLPTGNRFHALIWSDPAAPYNDLHPEGFVTSAAYDATGNAQVGEGMTESGFFHALLWYGTAGSAVDLHPSGYTDSTAFSVYGEQQVGYGMIGGDAHALLWRGAQSLVVDLNPVGMTESIAYHTDGTYQVGYAAGPATGGDCHAMMWVGTSAVMDMNPPGFTETWAEGLANDKQAGYGYGLATGGKMHALLWTGAPVPSVVDLHVALGAGYEKSYAYGIDPVTGQIVGEAITTTGSHVAVVWTPTVERLILPDAYNIQRGRLMSGNLVSLMFSDDQTLAVSAVVPTNMIDSPIMVEIMGTSPVHNPSVLTILLEARAQVANILQTIELYDYNLNAYVPVDTHAATTTDNVIEITPDDPQRFVQPSTNQMKARFRWRETAPIVMPGWRVNIDQSVWKITP